MSDDDELRVMLEEENKRSIRLRAKLGGSQATTNTTNTSQPAEKSSLNVFGDSSGSSSKHESADFNSILRQRRKRKELEKDVAELRQVAQKRRSVNVDRPRDSQERSNDQQPVDVQNPTTLPFFVNPPNWPCAPVFSSASLEDSSRPYTDIIKLAERNESALGSWFVMTTRVFNDLDSELRGAILKLLFWRVVYDATPSRKGSEGRQIELRTLLDCIRCCASEENENVLLPSITQVLESYGGSIPSVSFSKQCKDDSLDRILVVSGTAWNGELTKAVRNLSRGFHVWTELVSSGIDLRSVLGGNFSKGTYPIDSDIDYCIEICKLCARVLLCPFGSRLNRPVGHFICTVLNRISQEDWPRFRRKLARSLIDLTPSLELLVYMVDGLMPITSARARAICVQTSFFLLQKWGAGSISKLNSFCDALTEAESQDKISFSFADVVGLLEKFPSLSKDTDVSWAYLWARVLRFALLSDSQLLSSVGDEELLRFNVAMKRIKRYSYRLPFVTESRKFALTQDATLTSVCKLVNPGLNEKNARVKTMVPDGPRTGSIRNPIQNFASYPNSRPKKKQKQLTFVGFKLKRS